MAQSGTPAVVIHEVLERQHRIITLHGNGTSEVGSWAGLSEVANQGRNFAVVGESVLPQGIFTCREVDHQVLS